MSRLTSVAAIVAGFVALAAMRATTPHFIDITGPIGFRGVPDKPVRTDNLVVTAGQPRLARAIRFRAAGKVVTRDTGGVWLIVPVASQVDHKTTAVYGRTWLTQDGRRYAASERVEGADAVLTSTKTIQPGLVRHDLLVFEVHPDVTAGGTLLLSEQRFPQLTAEARIPFPKTPPAAPVAMLDLDDLHAKL
ncbi:hypothetical protein [Sphingomonas sp.]|uniref:hypothetical protein n=1 Tax=Sphingomonas sp. TaxID=28214 RepID=UPI003B3ADA4D